MSILVTCECHCDLALCKQRLKNLAPTKLQINRMKTEKCLWRHTTDHDWHLVSNWFSLIVAICQFFARMMSVRKKERKKGVVTWQWRLEEKNKSSSGVFIELLWPVLTLISEDKDKDAIKILRSSYFKHSLALPGMVQLLSQQLISWNSWWFQLCWFLISIISRGLYYEAGFHLILVTWELNLDFLYYETSSFVWVSPIILISRLEVNRYKILPFQFSEK